MEETLRRLAVTSRSASSLIPHPPLHHLRLGPPAAIVSPRPLALTVGIIALWRDAYMGPGPVGPDMNLSISACVGFLACPASPASRPGHGQLITNWRRSASPCEG